MNDDMLKTLSKGDPQMSAQLCELCGFGSSLRAGPVVLHHDAWSTLEDGHYHMRCFIRAAEARRSPIAMIYIATGEIAHDALAKRIGLSSDYVARVLKGQEPPGPAFAAALQKIFGLNSALLLRAQAEIEMGHADRDRRLPA